MTLQRLIGRRRGLAQIDEERGDARLDRRGFALS
jgi:hypothetical protein